MIIKLISMLILQIYNHKKNMDSELLAINLDTKLGNKNFIQFNPLHKEEKLLPINLLFLWGYNETILPEKTFNSEKGLECSEVVNCSFI